MNFCFHGIIHEKSRLLTTRDYVKTEMVFFFSLVLHSLATLLDRPCCHRVLNKVAIESREKFPSPHSLLTLTSGPQTSTRIIFSHSVWTPRWLWCAQSPSGPATVCGTPAAHLAPTTTFTTFKVTLKHFTSPVLMLALVFSRSSSPVYLNALRFWSVIGWLVICVNWTLNPKMAAGWWKTEGFTTESQYFHSCNPTEDHGPAVALSMRPVGAPCHFAHHYRVVSLSRVCPTALTCSRHLLWYWVACTDHTQCRINKVAR